MYGIEDLKSDILEQFNGVDESERDNKYFIKVMNYLICSYQEICKFDVTSWKSHIKTCIEQVNNKTINRSTCWKSHIKTCIEQDGLMFSCNYLLASKRNFTNTWSFLRKQETNYIEQIFNFYLFVQSILKDIKALEDTNNLEGIFSEKINVQIKFHDVITVSFLKEGKNKISSWVDFENFKNITELKGGYYVTISYRETALITIWKLYGDDIMNYLD